MMVVMYCTIDESFSVANCDTLNFPQSLSQWVDEDGSC